jgi:glycosyltransferase involved in cell wall biosynthesis
VNILQIIDEPWDSGITNYGLVLSAGLKRNGHKVIVAALEDKLPAIQAQRMYLNVRFIKSPRDIFGIVNIINQEKIELINAHTGSAHFLAVVGAIIAGRKVAIVRTRGDVRPPRKSLLNRLLASRTDKFIIAANFIREMYLKIGLPEKKLVTVYQGIDIEKFSLEKKIMSSLFSEKTRGTRIGIVGRLDPVKGHFSFLKAISLLKKKFNDIEILIVGKEENVKQIELEALADELGIRANILFAGFTANVPEIMANCDIGVISSVGSEAISRVLLEWMASGKPVVATRVGIIPEIVQEGMTGFLVPADDPQAMAEKIGCLIANKDKLPAMGASARKIIEAEFSQNTFISNTELVYEGILNIKR